MMRFHDLCISYNITLCGKIEIPYGLQNVHKNNLSIRAAFTAQKEGAMGVSVLRHKTSKGKRSAILNTAQCFPPVLYYAK